MVNGKWEKIVCNLYLFYILRISSSGQYSYSFKLIKDKYFL